jgi:lipid II:glycine glycyltransferase (peptidoglycan interpeptide bridge formation enzyme)
MLTNISSKHFQELFATPIVQQTAFWSEVKKRLGCTPLAVNFKTESAYLDYGQAQNNSETFHSLNKQVESDILVILQPLDRRHCMAYVPYGPELEPEESVQGVFLEELSECLRPYLPKECVLIRYDLCWESWWAKDAEHYDEQGHWLGEPNQAAQETRFNFSTQYWNLHKSTFNTLPTSTIYINLTPEKGALLTGMKSKTRYNINLALRKGVTVNTLGLEHLNIWYKLYEETAKRNRLFLNDISYFEAVLAAKATDSRSPAEVLLLVAELDHQPLSAMFLIISGDRGSYLYGASSSEHRNSMSTYALQWEAIQLAKAKGCTQYDMFGVSPGPYPSHPLHGLYTFKVGFGGQLYHSLGSWDYPLQPDAYTCFRSAELSRPGYHLA